MRRRHDRLRDERGFTLFSVFLLLILMATLASGSIVYSTLDLRSTTHYDTGNQALYAAEAGLVHSLTAINTIGVMHFKDDIATRWSTVWGVSLPTDKKTVPGHPDVQYNVLVLANNTNTSTQRDRGTLIATGFGPLGAKRVLTVTLQKGVFGGTGAIYLAADAVEADFDGTAFRVSGDNHNMDGTMAAGDQVPGISTRNDGVTSEVMNELSDGQKPNVQGQGFSLSPLTPSVLTTGGPDVADLDRIVNRILSTPGVITDSSTNINGNQVFGTTSAPQIRRMTAADVKLNGTADGAGILIVDGSLTVNGTLNFKGWIIVRGETIFNTQADPENETILTGTGDILGSLWTGHLEITVGGKAYVDYCKTCLELVDGIAPPNNMIPRPMVVSSWRESS